MLEAHESDQKRVIQILFQLVEKHQREVQWMTGLVSPLQSHTRAQSDNLPEKTQGERYKIRPFPHLFFFFQREILAASVRAESRWPGRGLHSEYKSAFLWIVGAFMIDLSSVRCQILLIPANISCLCRQLSAEILHCCCYFSDFSTHIWRCSVWNQKINQQCSSRTSSYFSQLVVLDVRTRCSLPHLGIRHIINSAKHFPQNTIKCFFFFKKKWWHFCPLAWGCHLAPSGICI